MNGNCWIDYRWDVQPVIRKIALKKDADGNLLYNEDGHLLYEDPVELTPDNDYISSFLVSKDGILVYTFENWEAGDYGIKMYADGATNELTGDTTGWWGQMFYLIGDGGTVIYGSSAGDSWGNEGIKFAQKHPVVPRSRKIVQLNTSLFTSRANSPTPSRIMMGDDGYIYGLFYEEAGYWDESQSTYVNRALINLFRILPYKQTPIVSIAVTGHWWDAMRGFDVQISTGYAYYVQTDQHPEELRSDRDVIKITRLTTGETKILLNTSHNQDGYTMWDDMYTLYSWKLVENKIHFSGFDNNASKVITGEIDVIKVRQGKPPLPTTEGEDHYLTIAEAASAFGESAAIRDMEVLEPEQVYDPVGAPVITKIYTDPENLYSASIDFSKYMNRSDVNDKVSIKDVATDEEIGYAMKLWSYRNLHIIFDTDAYNVGTDPLANDTMYEIAVDGLAFDQANVWQLIDADSSLLATTFKTVPDNGWYQSSGIALAGYSDGSVGKYVKEQNTDTNLDFYRLLGTKDTEGIWTGAQKQHFKVELSVQYLGDSWSGWREVTLRLNDAKLIDWANIDWSTTTITDSENKYWKWVDGHRTDDTNDYFWCNDDACGEGVEGIYDDLATVYEWKEGHDVDEWGNTYYWFWDDTNSTSGWEKYGSGGKDGEPVATIIWVDGFYFVDADSDGEYDEGETRYVWSFGEYRDENDSENIIDWASGTTYTWINGHHEEDGVDIEMPYLEWVSGKYVDVTDATNSITDWEYWDMDWVDGYYAQYEDSAFTSATGQTTSYWAGLNDPWTDTVDPGDMVENDKKDNWDQRLWTLAFDSSGQISGEYRTGEWDQSGWFDHYSTSTTGMKREWRKIVIEVYEETLKCSVLGAEGETITSFEETNYVNESRDYSGYYFLDLNVDSDAIILDNVIVTELGVDGDEVLDAESNPVLLFEETFSSASFDTSAFTSAGTYGSDW